MALRPAAVAANPSPAYVGTMSRDRDPNAAVLLLHVGLPSDRAQFSLTQSMVDAYAPNYFSAICSAGSTFAETTTRVVYLPNKDPQIFAHIVRFLQGYSLSLHAEQTWEMEAVKNDAAYFGLTGLMDQVDETMMLEVKKLIGPQDNGAARKGKVVDALDKRRLLNTRLSPRATDLRARTPRTGYDADTDTCFDPGESSGSEETPELTALYCLRLDGMLVLLRYEMIRFGLCDLYWRRGKLLTMILPHPSIVIRKIRGMIGLSSTLDVQKELVWASSAYVLVRFNGSRFRFTPEDIDCYLTSLFSSGLVRGPKFDALMSVTCSDKLADAQFVSWRVIDAVTMYQLRRTGETSFVAYQVLLQVEIDAGTNTALE